MSTDDGFMSRWSRRKVQARGGEVDLAKPPALRDESPPPESSGPGPSRAPTEGAAPLRPMAPASPQPSDGAGDDAKDSTAKQLSAPATKPLPTMDDVAQLTHASDYSRFVTPGVDADVRNAAMKKLFSDPHFNVMDGLDIYIDDYGKPDPLPASMLRQMVGADFLNLFPEDRARRLAEAADAAKSAEAAEAAKSADVASAHSTQDAALDPNGADQRLEAADNRPTAGATDGPANDPTSSAPTGSAPHEDTDLRLQPDDAAGRPGPEQGPRR